MIPLHQHRGQLLLGNLGPLEFAQERVGPVQVECFGVEWAGREHLRQVKVAEADIGAYRTLLSGVGGGS